MMKEVVHKHTSPRPGRNVDTYCGVQSWGNVHHRWEKVTCPNCKADRVIDQMDKKKRESLSSIAWRGGKGQDKEDTLYRCADCGAHFYEAEIIDNRCPECGSEELRSVDPEERENFGADA